jgi:hypothetical protein
MYSQFARLVILAFAVIVSYASGFDVSLSTTTNESGTYLEVINRSPSLITGFTYCVDVLKNGKKGGTTCHYFDVTVNIGHDLPVAPSTTRLLRMAPSSVACTHGRSGYILSDGSTGGDPVLIRVLLDRRKLVRSELQKIQATLGATAIAGDNENELLARLDQLKPAIPTSGHRDQVAASVQLLSGFAVETVVKSLKATFKAYPNRSVGSQRAGILQRVNRWEKVLCEADTVCANASLSLNP